MNKTEDKKEKIYLSTLAFLDEDFFETNERYLFEFCKLVISQNGYRGLSINEILLICKTQINIFHTLFYRPSLHFKIHISL